MSLEEERRRIQRQKDEIWRAEHQRTDACMQAHFDSYQTSYDEWQSHFNQYTWTFQQLNKVVRTDANGITYLLDNVASHYKLEKAG